VAGEINSVGVGEGQEELAFGMRELAFGMRELAFGMRDFAFGMRDFGFGMRCEGCRPPVRSACQIPRDMCDVKMATVFGGHLGALPPRWHSGGGVVDVLHKHCLLRGLWSKKYPAIIRQDGGELHDLGCSQPAVTE
jgi:hypothetical protein